MTNKLHSIVVSAAILASVLGVSVSSPMAASAVRAQARPMRYPPRGSGQQRRHPSGPGMTSSMVAMVRKS